MDPSTPLAPGEVPIDPQLDAPGAMPIDWTRISPDDFRKAAGLARRWCPMAMQYAHSRGVDPKSRPECNPDIVIIDLVLAHYWHGLNWDAMLRAPDADFQRAMVTLQLAIDRRARFVPGGWIFPAFAARPARLNDQVTERDRRF